MTRQLANTDVEVDLGGGTWTARWPATDLTAGPFTARVALADRTLDTREGAGAWSVEATATGGRARWTPKGDGPWLEVEVPTDGTALVVKAGYRARDGDVLDRITPVAGSHDLAYTARLVEGYDSWAFAGVVANDHGGQSFWRALFTDRAGRALALEALGAEQLCTRIVSAGPELLVECGASPVVQLAPGSWGYEVLEPESLQVPLAAGAEVVSEAIAIAAGADPFVLMEDLAARTGDAMQARRWNGPPVLGWESWYHYGLFANPDEIFANARLLHERYADRPGFDLVEIDDAWQATYGAWWPNDRYPEIAELTAELRALGCRPGLWLAPFMVQPDTPGLGTDHPEWMIRDRATDQPLVDRHGRWALDASHPDALAWLRELGEWTRACDVEMVKLDFLYLGAVEGARHDARVTGTEALRRGLRAFVDALGDDVYVLGCGAPLLPMVGICHGNRVGHDLAMPVRLRELGQPAEAWTGFAGIRPQARNVAARFALHRSWFDCDPDVVMAWGSNSATPDGYSLEESRTLATMAALCGGPFLLSDDLAALLPEERAVLEDPTVLDLAWGPGFRPVDLFERVDATAVEQYFAQPTDVASVWVAERDGAPVVALFNWTDEPATLTAPDGTTLELPAHAARVLRG